LFYGVAGEPQRLTISKDGGNGALKHSEIWEQNARFRRPNHSYV